MQELEDALSNLQSVAKDTLLGFRDIGKAVAGSTAPPKVPPLPPLPRSPILAAADNPPASASTTPYRAPALPDVPPSGIVEPAPLPRTKLRAIWTNDTRTERIATDGAGRVAYEASAEIDAVGDPVWKRVTLPFSSEAEAAVAQFFGAALSARAFAILLRTIASHECNPQAVSEAAFAMMTAVGIPTDGEILSDLLAVKPRAPSPAPMPMPPTGEPVAGNVVEVQHDGCALLVVTCDALPAMDDVVTGESFTGKIRRVARKDIGYDLLVEVMSGEAGPGPIGIARPQV